MTHRKDLIDHINRQGWRGEQLEPPIDWVSRFVWTGLFVGTAALVFSALWGIFK